MPAGFDDVVSMVVYEGKQERCIFSTFKGSPCNMLCKLNITYGIVQHMCIK